MNDPKKERLAADAEGHDIVGLKPGQKYDPMARNRANLRYFARKEAIERGEPVPPELEEDEDAEED